MASGQLLLDSTGKMMLDSSGKRMIAGTNGVCCLYQARDCATNTLQPIYVKKSDFPAFPSTYYFKYSGTCYYVQSSDHAACSNTPISGQTTAADCSCSCFKLTECGGAGVIYTMAALTAGDVYLYAGVCWVASTSTTCISPVSGPFTLYSSCSTCEASGTTCPRCNTVPSSLAISGWNGNVGNCGTSYPFDGTSGGSYPGWDEILLPPRTPACVPDINGTYPFAIYNDDFVQTGTTAGSFTFSDGVGKGVVASASLSCGDWTGTGGYIGWRLTIEWGTANGAAGCGNNTSVYDKAGTNTPIGAYALNASISTTCGCPSVNATPPASLTIS